jgi:uncharacterized protein YfaS (alpha-2-macroglobulin family)
MDGRNELNNTSRFWFCFLAALLAIAAASLMVRPSQAATGDSPVVTNSQGVLHVSIPYRAEQAGSGRLSIEILDPEDAVIARTQRAAAVATGPGRWQEDVKLAKPMASEDLVWHRLRYRFAYDSPRSLAIGGTESISQILRLPVVHILGQQSYLTGGPAAVRVIVTDSRNETISGPGTVRIELLDPGSSESKPRTVFTGNLNRRGTTEAQFRLPSDLIGNFRLKYLIDTPIGSTEFTQSVKLEDKVSILLTTEKPIYQPGQTIHVRALALDRASHAAAADDPLTLEVEDSRGNKVFKKVTKADKFGIASAEFALADEVNLGVYHLRALMGEPGAPSTSTSEIALNVERYVLPKFKVTVDFVGKDQKTKRGYRPGDHVTGTVHANYFFGKPVESGEITVKASSMDVAMFEAGSVEGKTDREGSFHFDLRLPNYFAGRPLTQGAARILIEATVKDSAGHAETRGQPITVSESPLLVTAVPEGGTLVPNLENQVFILTSYPDGTPAGADLKVQMPGRPHQNLSTDAAGVAIIKVPAGATNETLVLEADDREGNHASSKISLPARDVGEAQILLRTEHAVYRAGDRILLRVFSTKKRGPAYIDVVKEGQTVLTRDLEIQDGQAELTLTATPEMAGVVDFNAYLFGGDARPVGDHRLIFVQPADELKVEATAEAAVYRPGEDARIRFHVTDARGQGVQAALGLQVVDEAVFALAEKQPGFAKVFFYLEQEVLKPRYEIHSIGMPQVVETAAHDQPSPRDQAARALFSATEIVSANKFETEFGRTVPQTKLAEYTQRYQAQFLAEAKKLAEALSRAYAKDPGEKDLVKVFNRLRIAHATELSDSWDNSLHLDPVQWGAQKTHFFIHSAGPDKQFGTADDMYAYLEVQRRKIVGHASSGPSAIEIEMEHDRGAFNGHAEITGTIVDQWGGALVGVTIRLHDASSRRERWATAQGDGQFHLTGLLPGKYQVQVTDHGKVIAKDVELLARDRAVLSVLLRQDAAGTVVAVNHAERDVALFDVNGGIGFGVGGGVGGGRGGPGVGPGVVFDRLEAFGELNQAAVNAAPMAVLRAKAVSETVEVAREAKVGNSATLAKGELASSGARVRSYFPEALYINPEIITDRDGRASISIPLADSITTWRLAMLASTQRGALGSATSSLKVFQDFFVDLDLPVTLTQGDRVSIPVAVYNYSGSRGDVDLQLKPEDWFSLANDVPEKNISVDSVQVGGSQFTLQANRIGKYKLTLSARMKGEEDRADVVVREIEVIPNGREQNLVFNGRLEAVAQQRLTFPAEAIPDASKIFVRLYPGPLSQVIEGMDSLLRMPGGCFEQTSSSTYPNVLALDYMKRTKKLTPEVHAKAEGYIANGYQRLLTFEVPGGGFSWFGNAPANKILTAYGLMEFYDMSKVHDVDPKLITRTQQWLAAQQQPDGSWRPDTQFINEGATNRYNSDALRITAYIAWSLENTGYQGAAVDNAKASIEKHLFKGAKGSSGKLDAYTLAVIANFAVDYGRDRDFTREVMQLLLDARTEKDEQAWWSADETSVYATGASATVETTGLAVQGLLKWGQASVTARKALSYIAVKKDSSGAWGTTQATIMALRALLLATEKGAADVRGTVALVVNGKVTEKVELTPENNDLLHQFTLKNVNEKGGNQVEIRFDGKGSLAYQIVGRYFLPWAENPGAEPLAIEVTYDRTHLAQDDIATATATIKNHLTKPANMVMVDLGIPPGFDLLTEDLETYQEKSSSLKSGRLEKFSLTATQAILYFDSFAPGDTVKLHFRLRAKYPIHARTFQSRVYEYYDPDVSSVARPVQLEVRGR